MKLNETIFSGGIAASEGQKVNFREIRMGNIAPAALYRSSHPIKDNEQEKLIALLAAKARIATVLNLSDTNSEIKKRAILAPWYNKLARNERVIGLGMEFGFSGDNFRKKLKRGLQFITMTETPWLIHCHAGVDRTGFVSMVLESFMGASLDEIINDYLLSFSSGFDSAIYGEVKKTDSLVVMRLLSIMDDSQTITNQNLQPIAENYLKNSVRLSVKEIDLLRTKLSGDATVPVCNVSA